ncbi:alpha-glucuronidase [Kineococcus esterisolvens]|uniref:alpha-glucuronidase n=1 Tax=unclassified Kineococcus TaxID=2621656 RepID=UPI003D7D56C1
MVPYGQQDDQEVAWFTGSDPCWLPARRAARLAAARTTLLGDDPVTAALGEDLRALAGPTGGPGPAEDDTTGRHLVVGTLERLTPEVLGTELTAALDSADVPAGEGFAVLARGGRVLLTAARPAGLRHGLGWLLRSQPGGWPAGDLVHVEEPRVDLRVLDHWDNMTDGPMGVVERGYAGDSIFFADGRVRTDAAALARVRDYARLVSSIGVNAVCLNNVNVHAAEAHLLDEHLDDVARVAAVLDAHGVRTLLSVDFSAPISLGGLDTADPLDERVAAWWAGVTKRVATTLPGFGGYVVKADSENRPGPHTYGRTHADGANCLAAALAPFDAVVFWRCFVYDCHQDWRDRSTDRARAAHDHFARLDGQFAPNAVLQVKNGPMDFQVREPVSPLLGALPRTGVAVEFQITQEYTGQQKHLCHLGQQWSEVLRFDLHAHGGGEPLRVADVAARSRRAGGALTGVVGVANVGTDANWTGHALAQANLYAFGRLAWDPGLDPDLLLREWVEQTFELPADLAGELVEVMSRSWAVYESYTAPLGVGWMVRPGHHYGPDVDGYEYTPWGTYHFADRDGIGVDRTVATGTGYTAQYPAGWARVYEDVRTCPDELLLFFHHVPYSHVLAGGSTVVQHVYDTRFAGVEAVEESAATWERIAGHVPAATAENVRQRFAEQLRSAREWRDQVNTYFFRKSGVPDAAGRRIH